ncbi:MAG: hypothetical protein UW46_C0005G0005 [Candidatus Yanofskybacteria bacterium GW2011_GWF1_44_227]|uniref:Uncharacterized protein n=1 Tax=Candidatus Yanofskybacteria bacterium GW2011_GWE2_40_11 TaxID=1619033 RepID=A0A0G0QLF2_9BACT|nr:MAG: hypothetical protein UT75_C0002G0005 [Candidatus Yanofskybacteria bacterium GW2011_GWE2_40_11]KKT15552.1 MAG: hypothetical protein UV97_C0005G0045 [Candidatus Yanofskybacteria bacterium GW2011_GWF2_43_596]KKT53199.1 MAG: hypothetical protein UW46_C0005G0005 [Candidatus Yanofskybacteria bacterium GW2011_GWF1_44_227]OGN35590.1 MAG: hypothetical protein A2207_02525 [Candidatus Yanofskybacteria bacterium RIFOXYA1_FULL_44_17]OGN36705.1 MAG: hypothetical protein A2241_02855 [Candidatus Yanofs
MYLEIELFEDPHKVIVYLKEESGTVDFVEIVADHKFDHVLIGAVDKFLKKNKINPLSLKEVKVGGHIDKNSSSHKMVLAFVSALNS